MKHCLVVIICLLVGLACKKEAGNPVVQSGPDTTSHVFSAFHIDTLGDGNASVLRDVAIINDTLAYAVGEVYFRDSSGQGNVLTNLARWNGHAWSNLRVTLPFGGFMVTPILYGIWAFSAADIWLVGGVAIHGDGVNWTGYDVRSLAGYDSLFLFKCWGTSSRNMHFAGFGGSLAHFDGTTWQRQEAGTRLSLTSVYGTSSSTVYACGGDWETGQGVLLRYDGTGWRKVMDSYEGGGGLDTSQLFKTQLVGPLDGLWMDEQGTLYVSGDFLFEYKNNHWGFTGGIAGNSLDGSPYVYGFLTAVRGNAHNDFVVSGERTTMLHYNGQTGKQVGPAFNYFSSVHFYGTAMRGSLVIAVGNASSRASAMWMRR